MNKSHPADLGMRLGPGPGPDPRLFPTNFSPPPVSQRDLESSEPKWPSVSQNNGGSQGSQAKYRAVTHKDTAGPPGRPKAATDKRFGANYQ